MNNNYFKSNSRFESLGNMDSNPFNKNKKRQIDSDRKIIYDKKNENINNKFQDALLKENKAKLLKIEKDLSLDSFPELNSSNTSDKSCHNKNLMNYKDRIKNKEILEDNMDIDEDLINLKPGWVLIKKCPKNSSTIFKYKPNDEKINHLSLEEDDLIKNEKIINNLIDLYYKRTDEYINLWGYDDWEKEFRFPNYDYDYFDKLDEIMEEENEEEEELL